MTGKNRKEKYSTETLTTSTCEQKFKDHVVFIFKMKRVIYKIYLCNVTSIPKNPKASFALFSSQEGL